MQSVVTFIRRIPKPSPALLVGLLALVIALTGTAVAATGSLVNIADGTTATHVAKVDAVGKLAVGDGSGALTVDGTVTAQVAAPSAYWRTSGTAGASCTAIASPPAGKAVILKTVTINLYAAPSGSLNGNNFIPVYNNTTCTGSPIWDMTPTQLGPQVMTFEPGVGIPAGQALSTEDFSGAGFGIEVYATGYTVSSSAVPASAASEPTSGTRPKVPAGR